jgi:hypothetical protein
MDTLTELKRLHAEYVKACGPFKTYSYLVAPNEMALFALRNAFETAAAIEIPKLLACVEALEVFAKITVEGQDHNAFAEQYPSFAAAVAKARAALASLKGGA